MKKDLDLYRMKYDDETTDGIFAISLVSDPAIQKDFIHFNNKKGFFEIQDEDKRIVLGPVLIPNQKIYRRDNNGYEYEVVFTQEDINIFAEKFMLNDNNNNVTLQHSVTANNIKMIYFWKSNIENELGFGTPKGTLFTSYKILNDEVWEGVKDGSFSGFSIEVFATPIIMESHNTLTKDIADMDQSELDELMSLIKEKIQKK